MSETLTPFEVSEKQAGSAALRIARQGNIDVADLLLALGGDPSNSHSIESPPGDGLKAVDIGPWR
jgi:hypothetical protein